MPEKTERRDLSPEELERCRRQAANAAVWLATVEGVPGRCDFAFAVAADSDAPGVARGLGRRLLNWPGPGTPEVVSLVRSELAYADPEDPPFGDPTVALWFVKAHHPEGAVRGVVELYVLAREGSDPFEFAARAAAKAMQMPLDSEADVRHLSRVDRSAGTPEVH